MSDNQTIGQAIVFIEQHLYNPIVASDVAEAVSYSYHHFHRYFNAMMGETIGSYIRSRRLTKAAWELIHSEKKIIDIGLSLYFETAESFTRAFKKRYQMTPTEYRKNGIDILIGNRQSAQTLDETIITYPQMTLEMVRFPTTYIMGIRFNTSINGKESLVAWEQFYNQIPQQLLSSNRYEIYESETACSIHDFNPNTETSAFIGIEISKQYPISKGMQMKKITGGKYIKFIHKGTLDTLLQTYQYIWGVWFPKSGYTLADRDDFECYTNRFVGIDDETSEIDIYFPIQ